jgi:hypothetical protein
VLATGAGLDRELDPRGDRQPPATPRAEDRHRVAERGTADGLDARQEGRLLEARRGHEGAPDPVRGERPEHRQEPRHRPDLAAERQLPDERRPAADRAELLRPEEDPDGDRKIDARAALR